MKIAHKTAAAMAVLAFAIAGCASAPDSSPRLLAAEASLQQAKSNPNVLEAGRASLEKASASLSDARVLYAKGKDDDFEHAVRMSEGYVELAETRADQVEANAAIASLNRDRAEFVSQARLRKISLAEAATANAEARANQSEIAAAVAVAESAASESGRLAAEARTDTALEELASYEQKKTQQGLTLILRDLQFGSGSSALGSGATGRLAPLAAFLTKQPATRIQITGHTDSQGSESSNLDLSARRAQSVGAYLNSTGVEMNRVSSIGLGEASPVATNATAAGRAINRRVEVTILD